MQLGIAAKRIAVDACSCCKLDQYKYIIFTESIN
jgi:hypothetical protein